MGCKKCGSGGSVVTPAMQQDLQATGDMLLMEYIGVQTQKRRLKSKSRPHETYVFSGDQRKFLAYKGDVPWLTAMANQFRLAPAPVVTTAVSNSEVPVLTSTAKPIKPVLDDLPIDVLTLDPITLGLLKRKFSTVNEVRNAGRAEWLTIKGIGAARADDIGEALNALKSLKEVNHEV